MSDLTKNPITYSDKVPLEPYTKPPENREPFKLDQEKPRMDLIPAKPMLIVGQVFTHGLAKYPDRNWEGGFKYGRPYAAALRHLLAWWTGEDKDPESGLSHLAHAICCILMLLEFEEVGTGTDDRPHTERTI